MPGNIIPGEEGALLAVRKADERVTTAWRTFGGELPLEGYDTAGLSRLLGIDEDTIGEHIKAHTLLGCRTEGGSWRYPALQSDEYGRTVARLRELLDLLLAGTDDGNRRWRAARWLAPRARTCPRRSQPRSG